MVDLGIITVFGPLCQIPGLKIGMVCKSTFKYIYIYIYKQECHQSKNKKRQEKYAVSDHLKKPFG